MAASFTAERKAGTGTVSGTSFAFSPATTCTQGATLYLMVYGESSTGATAVSDNAGGNTWAFDQSTAAGVVRTSVFSVYLNTAIGTGNTITVSLANGVAYAYWLEEFAADYSSLDVSAQSNGSNSTTLPTGTTGTTNFADEVAICTYAAATASVTITKNASYTLFTTGTTNVGTAGTAQPSYRLLVATGTQNADGTCGSMVNSRNGIVTYKNVSHTVIQPNPLVFAGQGRM